MYSIEDIVKRLKQARLSKGMSQRDLSAKTGVPQSHISKIESGKNDIRLSSLVEIARVLDLEVQLVPKQALPAVRQVVKSAAPQMQNYGNAKEFRKTLDTLAMARDIYPDVAEFREALNSFKVIQNQMSLNPAAIKKLNEAYEKQIKDLKLSLKVAGLDDLRALNARAIAVAELSEEQRNRISEMAKSARMLRNELVHLPIEDEVPKPAYALDMED